MPHNSRSSQLIHIDVDRRLGHEWDEWDGKPLPGGGDFRAPASRFFWYAALTISVLVGAAFFLAYLLVPRLEELWEPARAVLFVGLGFLSGLLDGFPGF